jgi:solute carrier family 15 oligopeptide transporter 1
MKVPNRRSDDRRPSARFVPAAEPLLVIDCPVSRPRSRAGSYPSSAASIGETQFDAKMASIVPSTGLGADNPKSGPPHDPHTWHPDNDDEAPKSLIASIKSYPKGVFFMLGNEFCERFSFYGMRAVLIMYFIYQHNFDTSTAKFLYHGFVSMAYLSPLIGSIAADNYFGRFRVILWVSLLYVLGHTLLSIGAVPYLTYSIQTTLDFSGLFMIALATGGIKPCVSAFAADQFNENQHQQRAQFFSFFYFSINAGSLLAIMLTPLLRGRVSCFGSPYCFPLAFGVPGVLMLVAFVIFLSGWKFYKITPAGKGNAVWKVLKCIGCALKGKLSAVLKRQDKAAHWVDYASPQFSDPLIAGVKSLLAVSLLFVPVVFFWALFDQQGSTWVLQASQMDGRVGPFTILPDQMNTFNPLIILITVPLFEGVIYPFTRKFVKITPLRKMGAGGILAAISFIMAGFLQFKINATLEPFPSDGNVFIQKFGSESLPFVFNETTLAPGKNEIPSGIYTAKIDDFSTTYNLSSHAYILGIFDNKNGPSTVLFPYKLDKASNGQTNLIILVDADSPLKGTPLVVLDNKGSICAEKIIEQQSTISILPAIISSKDYVIHYGKNCLPTNISLCDHQLPIVAETGAVNVLYFDDEKIVEMRQIVQSNSVSVLWQLPQFFVIALGEVLFSVTGLEFSYSQAAPNMKSVLQAMWLVTTFAGNVIDMGISGSRLIHEPALEFFFYAFLMFIVIGIFILIALNYKYVDEEALESQSEAEAEAEAATEKKDTKLP